MDEHLTKEQISALLDEGVDAGGEGPGAHGHLDACDRCRGEFERMRRMRMALSALDDLQAPAGLWAGIASRLPSPRGEDSDATGGSGSWLGRLAAGPGAGWMRAAAAVVLFAAGVGLGTSLGDLPSPPGEDAAERTEAVADRDGGGADVATDRGAEVAAEQPRAAASGSVPEAAALVSDGGEAAYREALRRLERLRRQGPSPEEAMRRPSAALEHMARLDALIRASREALRDDPANPALNEFLFEAMEERQTLNDALRFSSVEIR